jgi:low temperature requirement protein LtrA
MPTKDNSWLLRIGSGAAVLGAVAAGAGNLLHPITPRDDPAGVARVIAQSDLWTHIHLVIVIGIILLPAGLLAVRHSSAGGGFTDALTRLGMYAVTMGATVGVITLIWRRSAWQDRQPPAL